jgi:hypothetical protein
VGNDILFITAVLLHVEFTAFVRIPGTRDIKVILRFVDAFSTWCQLSIHCRSEPLGLGTLPEKYRPVIGVIAVFVEVE